uniref:Uncharacterized protein n=1 Tax=Pipistrellus kuhlii TaxID=59472 RepID=A0A7J7U885_PIPKU|nr:hypothetical protein mPipKuh1_009179 [Pipistrellus kuhlii]
MSRHCPSVDCHASVPTCLVYILKRCAIPPPCRHLHSREPSWRNETGLGAELTDTGGVDPKPSSLAFAGCVPCPPPRRSYPTLGSSYPGLVGLIWVRDPRGLREQHRWGCSTPSGTPTSPWDGSTCGRCLVANLFLTQEL